MDCTQKHVLYRVWLFLGLEVEVVTLGESVELDLSRGEESVPGSGGDTRKRPGGGGEVPSSQVTGQVSSLEGGDLVRGVVGVDEGGLRLSVFVVLVVVLLGGAVAVQVGPGGVLPSTGDVVTFKNPEAVYACAVLDGDLLSVGRSVAVLADPLVVALALLPVHNTVLLGKGGPKGSLASIEPLLLQYLGKTGVSLVLGKTAAAEQGNLGEKGEH